MAKTNSKLILDIVPLTRITLSRNQSFSYLSDMPVANGSLVKVPLFRRELEGIVIGQKNDFPRLGNIELKNIKNVIEENFLDQKQLDLAKFLSEYYISPLGIVLKNFVPSRTRSRNVKRETHNEKNQKVILTKEQSKAVEIITGAPRSTLHAPRYLLFGPSGSGKTEVYIHSISKLKAQNPQLQFLILLPEKTLTPQAIERFGEYFSPEETVVLTSNVAKGQYYSNWLKIKSGEAKIIIGTRMAVFAPFQKLGLIVVDEEQDISHKQWDMNPRYDARKASEELSRLHNCSVVRGSATPSLESYYKTQIKNHFQLLELPPLKLPNTIYQIQNTILVDMRKERWAKNYSCISKKLKAEIAYALKYHQQSILFINRQGMSNFSICAACKTVIKCPKCERALIYDSAGHFRCPHCVYRTSITPQCPKCKGIVFKNVGLGTQKVEKEISSIFPGARIARIDTQTVKDRGYQDKIYQEFKNGAIDILVGTQMIAKGWDLPNVALVGIIDTDNQLSIPDFFAGERFFQNMVQVAGRTGRPGSKFPGAVVIQTFEPENRIIKSAAEKDFEAFYGSEIMDRQGLSLPPFSKLIKLVFQDINPKKAENEANRVSKILEIIKGIKISEPEKAFIPNIRGRWRWQITIKIPLETEQEELFKELKKLGSGWIIDVDPISNT